MHFCSPLCEPATMAAMAHHTRHSQVGREGFPVLVFASLIHRPQGWPREAHSHPTLTLQVHSPFSLKTCQSSLSVPAFSLARTVAASCLLGFWTCGLMSSKGTSKEPCPGPSAWWATGRDALSSRKARAMKASGIIIFGSNLIFYGKNWGDYH